MILYLFFLLYCSSSGFLWRLATTTRKSNRPISTNPVIRGDHVRDGADAHDLLYESWQHASDKESRIMYFRKDNDKVSPWSQVTRAVSIEVKCILLIIPQRNIKFGTWNSIIFQPWPFSSCNLLQTYTRTLMGVSHHSPMWAIFRTRLQMQSIIHSFCMIILRAQ